MNTTTKRYEWQGAIGVTGGTFVVVEDRGDIVKMRSDRTGEMMAVPSVLLGSPSWREMAADEKACVAPTEYADEW